MSGTTDHTEADPEHPGGGPCRAWLAARAREKAAIMEVKRLTAEREALLAVAQAAQAATFALWENSDEERAAADALRAALGRLNQDTPHAPGCDMDEDCTCR